MDRRKKYTKMVIQEAFYDLIKKKPFSKITVSDICKSADISRPTFYLHYEDIYALLDEIGENMVSTARLDEIMKLSIQDKDAIYRFILNLLQIIEKNVDVYRICVLERGVNNRIPAKITEAIQEVIIRKWEQGEKLHQEFDKQYISEYIQAGFNSLVYCWINKKDSREPIEVISKLIEQFLIYGLSGFVPMSSKY